MLVGAVVVEAGGFDVGLVESDPDDRGAGPVDLPDVDAVVEVGFFLDLRVDDEQISVVGQIGDARRVDRSRPSGGDLGDRRATADEQGVVGGHQGKIARPGIVEFDRPGTRSRHRHIEVGAECLQGGLDGGGGGVEGDGCGGAVRAQCQGEGPRGGGVGHLLDLVDPQVVEGQVLDQCAGLGHGAGHLARRRPGRQGPSLHQEDLCQQGDDDEVRNPAPPDR